MSYRSKTCSPLDRRLEDQSGFWNDRGHRSCDFRAARERSGKQITKERYGLESTALIPPPCLSRAWRGDGRERARAFPRLASFRRHVARAELYRHSCGRVGAVNLE